jgi:hypothetical protein
MRRKLLNLVGWLSLILSVTTTVVGVRGCGSLSQTVTARNGKWTFHSFDGKLAVVQARVVAFESRPVDLDVFAFRYSSFSNHEMLDPQVTRTTIIEAPVVTSSLIIAGFPLLFSFTIYARWRSAKKRSARGLCAYCGYSLVGNTSGVCPECGKTMQAPETTRVQRADE